MGAYDGIRSDIIYDERFKKTQWAADFNHGLGTSLSTALMFNPAKDAGQHDVEKLVRSWADSRGHAVDSDWTKYYVHAGQDDYAHGRDRTLSTLRADR
ncbi:hypothetical protein [Streptomyces sp. NPDC003996]